MCGQIGTADVGELQRFEMTPDALIGVEVGSVAWQSFQPDTAAGLTQPVFDHSAAVDRRAVPDHQQSVVDPTPLVLREANRAGPLRPPERRCGRRA